VVSLDILEAIAKYHDKSLLGNHLLNFRAGNAIQTYSLD